MPVRQPFKPPSRYPSAKIVCTCEFSLHMEGRMFETIEYVKTNCSLPFEVLAGGK